MQPFAAIASRTTWSRDLCRSPVLNAPQGTASEQVRVNASLPRTEPGSGSGVCHTYVCPQLFGQAEQSGTEHATLHRWPLRCHQRQGGGAVLRVQVCRERTSLGEAVRAQGTPIGPLARVCPQVALEVALVSKRARAQAALERPLARVGALMHNEAALVHRREGALAAPELTACCCCSHLWNVQCRQGRRAMRWS